MNRTRLFIALLLSLAFHASALTLTVKQDTKIDNEGKTNDTKTQTRTLDMTVTSLENGSVQAELRYWFFARNMKTGKETTFKRGTKTASLEHNEATTIQSETVTSTYIEEHVEVEKAKGNKGGGGKGKGAKSTTKKVPASGDRITGYAVQVLIGKEVVADYYSAPSYKQMLLERGK